MTGYSVSGRYRRLAVVFALVLAATLAATGALSNVAAHARRHPHAAAVASEPGGPPAGSERAATGASGRAWSIAGLAVARLGEGPPPSPSHGRPAPEAPNASRHVEVVTYTVKVTGKGFAEFVPQDARIAPVPRHVEPVHALADASARAERDSVRAVTGWAVRAGAAAVATDDVREVVALLTEAVESARGESRRVARLVCQDGAAGTGCAATDAAIALADAR